MIKKEAENVLRYKDLTIEIHCMWNVKAKVIPVSTAATGTISKSRLSNVPGKQDIKERQKTAVLGTAHIYCGKCCCKAQNIFHGRNNITCSTNCKYRTAVTLCTLETWFVSGI